MQKPVKAEAVEDQGIVNLFFPDDEKRGIPHRMVGAVTWPVGMVPGYCLIAGQHTRTRVLSIFEEFPFWSVGTTHGEPGIWYCLNSAWKNYKCRRLYHCRSESHLRFLLQTVRESLVTVKPSFIEVDLSQKGEDNVDNLILEYQRRGLIRIDKDANPITMRFCKIDNLYGQLQTYAKGYSIVEDGLPAVISLRALIAGIERTPYHAPAPEPQPQQSYF